MKSVAVYADSDLNYFDTAAFAKHTLTDWQTLASVMDHTLLRPDVSEAQLMQHCLDAVHFGFASVMVPPCWVSLAYSVLASTPVITGSVVAFPQGSALMTTKRGEAEDLLRVGAHELDMVANVGALKSGNRNLFQQDIHAVVEVAHNAGARVKAILETCLLTLEEKILASELAIAAGADFLKTSTGYAGGGATVHDVSLLRGVAGSRCEVKASGGVRTLDDARQMLEAGASRIGSSACVSIVRELGAR
jgi:deoxyribose-phosphate aldolase